MKKITEIPEIQTLCTGCMACADVCPVNCIDFKCGDSGFLYPVTNEDSCVDCGKCYSVCPVANYRKHKITEKVFAAYATDRNILMRGSSGGIFELLALNCLEKGYYICGASFEDLKCHHKIIDNVSELGTLLKSKYIQSSTLGIYKQVLTLLEKGEHVFFCGAPCQVSALLNATPEKVKGNLLTAEFICHGVPSQFLFDEYIKCLENKHRGKVTDFSFRVKDNKYKHAHGFHYCVRRGLKTKKVESIYSKSTFYNAFKKYLILRDGCYECRYATAERVADITLADFWGVEKFGFNGNTDNGVSMLILSTENGKSAFAEIGDKVISKSYPIEYGIETNHCLTHCTKIPKNRADVIESLKTRGYAVTAKKYFRCGFAVKLYWALPRKIRNLIRGVRGK